MVTQQYFVCREDEMYLAMALNDGDPTGRGETIDDAIAGAQSTFESLCLAVDDAGGRIENCLSKSYFSFPEIERKARKVKPDIRLCTEPRRGKFEPSEGKELFPKDLNFEYYIEKRI